MTKNQFIRFVKNCNPELLTSIAITRSGKVKPVEKITVTDDKKKFRFHLEKSKKAFTVNVKSIYSVDMLFTSQEGYSWSILVATKYGTTFKVHFNMAEGYSPYAYTENFIENYKDVASNIPKYMDKFIGKTVTVLHYIDKSMYRTFNEEDESRIFPVTDSYIINDFDYEIFYGKFSSNVPCIKMYSKSNDKIFTCAMGVNLITDYMGFTADGRFRLNVIE